MKGLMWMLVGQRQNVIGPDTQPIMTRQETVTRDHVRFSVHVLS